MSSIKLTPISRPNIADMVLEQLLDQLTSGRLKLGDKLPAEVELASQVGIGRNSVREAMKVLQVLGVIERRQGDGSYVAQEPNVPFKSLLLSLFSRIGTSEGMVELLQAGSSPPSAKAAPWRVVPM